MLPNQIYLSVMRPAIFLFFLGCAGVTFGQGTGFTYQGRFQDGGANANGSYDFQFTLWDAVSGGTQQPQPALVTVTKTSVAVSNGIFAVQLDFGATAFPGANRWLETSARLAGSGPFVILSPRQPITATPYAIRSQDSTAADSLSASCNNCVQSTQISSLAGAKVVGIVASATTATNATQLGGVPANQFVVTSDSRLTDSRIPTAGSPNYIQNTSSPQALSSFNVSSNSVVGASLNVLTTLNVGGTLVTGCPNNCIPIIFNGPPNPKLIVLGNAYVAGNSVFNTVGTNGVRLSPASDTDIGVLNVTNAANTINWLTVGNNGQVIMNGSGNVGIGTASPDAKLTVNGSADKPGGGSWGTFSDERLKDIKGKFTRGLSALMQLQPIRYQYKRDNVLNLKVDGQHIGFSAQAVQRVIPEAVTAGDSGFLIINNDPILWTMVNSIREQQTMISSQEDQIKRAHIEIENQQRQLNALKNLVCRSHRSAKACR